MAQHKLSAEIMNNKEAFLLNRAPEMRGAKGAAPNAALRTCIQPHPWVLRVGQLGCARGSVTLLAWGSLFPQCWSCSHCSAQQRGKHTVQSSEYSAAGMTCISSAHLENLIPLIDICHNAVLPGS